MAGIQRYFEDELTDEWKGGREVGQDPDLPKAITMQISGRVETPYPNSIPNRDFDQFMLDEEIFSHAIKSFRMIRYTTDLEV